MRSFITFCLFLFSFTSIHAQGNISIIPKPVSYIPFEGVYKTNLNTIMSKLSNAHQSFTLANDLALGKEGYRIKVTSNMLSVTANSEVGFFYAIQTLMQLMPPQVYGQGFSDLTEVSIPCCEIIDYPRFPYRGLHLDVSRHIFPVSFIKKYIDLMAMHKMNFFHWHLTDDQGWRIEIKQYPKLQEIASKRKETWIGHYNSGLGYDGKPYGGYYTQKEVKEIVDYAKSRYITIIPEIELPGHAQAALAAYPEFSCTGGPHQVATTWGVFDEVYCPTEETFTFLENILTEVIALFPNSPYIHVGGDECPKTRWKTCSKCQERIKKEGLKDEHELQTYFVNRIAGFLYNHGKQVIGWDEVLEGGAPNDIIVMSWRGEEGAISAVNQNHYAIMTPNGFMYLDYYQGVPESEPTAIGGFLTLNRVYSYDPIPKEIPIEKQHLIMGLQGNLWTEYIPTSKHAEYMAYPRACAIAEIGWSPVERKDYNDFLSRLSIHFDRLDALNVNYAKSHFAVKAVTVWGQTSQKPEVQLTTDCKDCEIRYTIDGKEPTNKSQNYVNPIILEKSITIKAIVFKNGKIYSPIYSENFQLSLSTGKSYSMNHVNPAYSGGHKYALTDGIVAQANAWNRWVGTLGKDMDVTIDLNKTTPINKVKMQFYNAPDSWIYAPTEVSLFVSNDGIQWQEIESKNLNPIKGVIDVEFKVKSTERFVKVVAKSIGKIPKDAQGAGNDAHLFCNEIVIE